MAADRYRHKTQVALNDRVRPNLAIQSGVLESQNTFRLIVTCFMDSLLPVTLANR